MQRTLGGNHGLALVVAVVLVAGVLVAGCGSSVPGQTGQATTTASTTATTQPTPTATLLPVAFQTPPNCTPVAPGAFPTGVYVHSDAVPTLDFQPNGQLVPGDGDMFCYGVVQHHLLYFDVARCYDSPTMYGDYTWTFDGKVLRMTLVQDHCSWRAHDLVGGFANSNYYWTRQTGG